MPRDALAQHNSPACLHSYETARFIKMRSVRQLHNWHMAPLKRPLADQSCLYFYREPFRYTRLKLLVTGLCSDHKTYNHFTCHCSGLILFAEAGNRPEFVSVSCERHTSVVSDAPRLINRYMALTAYNLIIDARPHCFLQRYRQILILFTKLLGARHCLDFSKGRHRMRKRFVYWSWTIVSKR